MIARSIAYRAEISFWNVIIPLMSTSPIFQRIFRSVYIFTRDHRELAIIPTVVVTFASLGLLTGFVIGRLGVALP